MEPIAFNNISVLLVDDNVYMRRIIHALLSAFGIRQVYEADDGEMGLDMFAQFNPDIIITDWSMPRMNGIEMVRAIRKPDESSNPFVPIIMLSGYAEKRRVLEARDAGVHEFLCKPISARALYLRLYSVIAYPRPFMKTTNFFGPDRRRFANPLYKGPEKRDPTAFLDTNEAQRMSAANDGGADASEQAGSGQP